MIDLTSLMFITTQLMWQALSVAAKLTRSAQWWPTESTPWGGVPFMLFNCSRVRARDCARPGTVGSSPLPAAHPGFTVSG